VLFTEQGCEYLTVVCAGWEEVCILQTA